MDYVCSYLKVIIVLIGKSSLGHFEPQSVKCVQSPYEFILWNNALRFETELPEVPLFHRKIRLHVDYARITSKPLKGRRMNASKCYRCRKRYLNGHV